MRSKLSLLLACAGLVLASTASAQLVATPYDTAAPRAGVTVGYGGRGIDWEVSADSRRMADLFRVRVSIGEGYWVGWDTSFPPAGTNPRVTRASAAALLYFHDRMLPGFFGYAGLGVVATFPHHADMHTQFGPRFIVGMEGAGEIWSAGPEIQLDVPAPGPESRQFVRESLLPTARLGFAIRHRF